ncbi:hypothetical protein BSLG_005980 [Batrachochytrium salamandrivorans]|nr:hypothetical protein BSLG_005980 [Batrachochytrium salamandrivorans]
MNDYRRSIKAHQIKTVLDMKTDSTTTSPNLCLILNERSNEAIPPGKQAYRGNLLESPKTTFEKKSLLLEETIKNKTNQLRQLGESGRVKDAYDLYSAVERSMVELDQLRQTDQTHPSYRPDKKMEVCEICGALLANDSTGQRIDAHMTGKQHTGFIRFVKLLKSTGFVHVFNRFDLLLQLLMKLTFEMYGLTLCLWYTAKYDYRKMAELYAIMDLGTRLAIELP